MPILLYWREIAIASLVACCLWLYVGNKDLKHELKETIFTHQKLVNEAKLQSANIVATAQRQRQIDAEKYAHEVNILNDRYNSAMSNVGRMQQEITTYNTRLETLSRETVENYAKVGSSLYNECRKEYLDLGYYAARLDAELDKVTTTKKPSK